MDNAEIERRLEEAGTYKPTKGNWWKRWHPSYHQMCSMDKCCFGYNQWFKRTEVDPDEWPFGERDADT